MPKSNESIICDTNSFIKGRIIHMSKCPKMWAKGSEAFVAQLAVLIECYHYENTGKTIKSSDIYECLVGNNYDILLHDLTDDFAKDVVDKAIALIRKIKNGKARN
jgi:hypothetical protein